MEVEISRFITSFTWMWNLDKEKPLKPARAWQLTSFGVYSFNDRLEARRWHTVADHLVRAAPFMQVNTDFRKFHFKSKNFHFKADS